MKYNRKLVYFSVFYLNPPIKGNKMTKNIITLAIAGAILAFSISAVNAKTENNVFNKQEAFPAFPNNG
jgi:archaellum biogenesis protein FlaJ (TadC family)